MKTIQLIRFSIGAFVVFAAACFFLSLIVSEASASKGVRALERIHLLKEGTRRANRLMKVNTSRVPWCGAAMCYSLRVEGKRCHGNYLNARSWETNGRSVKKSSVARGHFVTFRSKYAKSGRHVGRVIARKGSRVKVSSGNQKNRINEKWYSIRSIVKVRKY